MSIAAGIWPAMTPWDDMSICPWPPMFMLGIAIASEPDAWWAKARSAESDITRCRIAGSAISRALSSSTAISRRWRSIVPCPEESDSIAIPDIDGMPAMREPLDVLDMFDIPDMPGVFDMPDIPCMPPALRGVPIGRPGRVLRTPVSIGGRAETCPSAGAAISAAESRTAANASPRHCSISCCRVFIIRKPRV